MGNLSYFDLNSFSGNDITFIETGTGRCEGILTALRHNFRLYISIEVLENLYERARHRLSDNQNVILFLGKSEDVLPIVLNSTLVSEKIVFWLDAHFPGSDYDGFPYVFNEENLPLERELNAIKKERNGKKDIIIIDDLRIYKNIDGISALMNEKKGIDFIENLFGETHNFKEIYVNEGYLLLTPK